MSETNISRDILIMIRKEFGDLITITRHHCGLAKGWHGGIIKLGDNYWSDYIGYAADGHFVGIEVKDPEGKTAKLRREGQQTFRENANRSGAYVIQTDGVDDCRKQLLLIKEKILEHLRLDSKIKTIAI